MSLVLALLWLGAAEPDSRQQLVAVMPESAADRKPHEEWGFSEATIVDGTVYVSGVVVNMKRGGDMRSAYAGGFRYLGEVLTRAGAAWSDVVDITTYHTDLASQMPALVEVKNRFIKAPFPAWTAVQVVRLIPDEGITEIKIVAKLRK